MFESVLHNFTPLIGLHDYSSSSTYTPCKRCKQPYTRTVQNITVQLVGSSSAGQHCTSSRPAHEHRQLGTVHTALHPADLHIKNYYKVIGKQHSPVQETSKRTGQHCYCKIYSRSISQPFQGSTAVRIRTYFFTTPQLRIGS